MDLLIEMVELVKPGEEKTQLFAMLFMHRLPPQVRVQLTEDNHTDLRALAEKAERWAAMLVRKAGATEEESEDHTVSVSAVHKCGGQRGGKHKKTGYWQQKKQTRQRQPGQQPDSSSPADVAHLASGLCYLHFKFGAKAFNCQQPCNWQGN